jgi:hypothetical protein
MKTNDAHLTAEAVEHLRSIRQLMENATYYQALTARGALVGGLGGIALAAWQYFHMPTTQGFLNQWLGMLILVLVVNFAQLSLNAKQQGTTLISANFIRTIRATAPALSSGFLLSQTIGYGQPSRMAILWILTNGIALLSAVPMVPRALGWLGLAFFTLGTGGLVWNYRGLDAFPTAGPVYMGASFGLFNLVYAIIVMANTRNSPPPSTLPTE